MVSAPDLPTAAHLEGKAHQGGILAANVTPYTHPDTQETSLSQTEHTSAPGKAYPGKLGRVHRHKTSVLSIHNFFQSTLVNNYPLDIFILLSEAVAFCFQPKWDNRSKFPSCLKWLRIAAKMHGFRGGRGGVGGGEIGIDMYTLLIAVVWSLSCVWLFAIPRTVAHQALLSVGFSRQEYWSGLPSPSPGDLLDPGIKPVCPALQADAFTVWATREAPAKCWK